MGFGAEKQPLLTRGRATTRDSIQENAKKRSAVRELNTMLREEPQLEFGQNAAKLSSVDEELKSVIQARPTIRYDKGGGESNRTRRYADCFREIQNERMGRADGDPT